jgi:hypothetical protein
MPKRLSVLTSFALAALAGPVALAQAQDGRLIGDSLTIGTFSPTYGVVTLPMASSGALALSALPWSLSTVPSLAASASTSFLGGEVGMFARYADRPAISAFQPATSYNVGAAVGYAGFYLQGAVTGANEHFATRLLNTSWQSLRAGLGYGVGALDVRLTYSMGQSSPAFADAQSFENNQWMLGGIYQLTPGIRLNADAFYGSALLAAPATAVGASAPQGTGARVGVQLRF